MESSNEIYHVNEHNIVKNSQLVGGTSCTSSTSLAEEFNSEAFQGIKVTSDMTLKTSDTGISNQGQVNYMLP